MLYTNTTYTLLFGFVFGAWAVSEILGPVRWSRLREGSQRDQGTFLLSVLGGSLGAGLALLFPLLLPAARLPWQPLPFFVGSALVCIGAGWRWYAIRTLGRFFTATIIIQDHHSVVQEGPYKLVRHPSYSGVIVLILGIGFMIGNALSLLLLTTSVLVGILYRIRVEEQELLRHFGEVYADYMQRTKRLIPFVF